MPRSYTNEPPRPRERSPYMPLAAPEIRERRSEPSWTDRELAPPCVGLMGHSIVDVQRRASFAFKPGYQWWLK